MAKTDLTAQRLRELLHYCPDSGLFSWAVTTPWKQQGQAAGCVNTLGYHVIRLDRVLYTAHRLAWLYVHGEWPKQSIDHIDGNRQNNRMRNLRDVSAKANAHNHWRARSNSKSGVQGVSWSKVMKRWHATITLDGRRINLGYFQDIHSAERAYLENKAIYHAETVKARQSISCTSRPAGSH